MGAEVGEAQEIQVLRDRHVMRTIRFKRGPKIQALSPQAEDGHISWADSRHSLEEPGVVDAILIKDFKSFLIAPVFDAMDPSHQPFLSLVVHNERRTCAVVMSHDPQSALIQVRQGFRYVHTV